MWCACGYCACFRVQTTHLVATEALLCVALATVLSKQNTFMARRALLNTELQGKLNVMTMTMVSRGFCGEQCECDDELGPCL